MSVKTAGGVARASGASGLRNGVSTGVSIRPAGYEFPVGISVLQAATVTTVDYLVVAGGGGAYIGGGGAGGFSRLQFAPAL